MVIFLSIGMFKFKNQASVQDHDRQMVIFTAKTFLDSMINQTSRLKIKTLSRLYGLPSSATSAESENMRLKKYLMSFVSYHPHDTTLTAIVRAFTDPIIPTVIPVQPKTHRLFNLKILAVLLVIPAAYFPVKFLTQNFKKIWIEHHQQSKVLFFQTYICRYSIS